MADKSQRELYLSDPLHHVEHSDHDKVVPPWLVAEASTEEEWEKAEKEKLEVNSWAREFHKKFLNAYKTENRQMIAVWEPEKAAAWLKEKVLSKDGGFDRNKASEILAAAQCLDEKRTEVMLLVGATDEKRKPESGSPTRDLHKVTVPTTVNESMLEKEEYKRELRKKKAVGSYGIVLTEESCLLYRKGEKLAEVSVEACGGYPILADEIDAMEKEAEVEAFFDLHDDLEQINSQGWLKPKGAPIYDGATEDRNDQLKGDTSVFDSKEVPQAAPHRIDPLNPGPASLTPGADTPIAPQIPGQDGK
jgi:hypothetical protein